jgi:hypothetical protein
MAKKLKMARASKTGTPLETPPFTFNKGLQEQWFDLDEIP